MTLRAHGGRLTWEQSTRSRVASRLMLASAGALFAALAWWHMPPRLQFSTLFLGLFLALGIVWLVLAVVPWGRTRIELGPLGMVIEEGRAGSPRRRTIPPDRLAGVLTVRTDPPTRDQKPPWRVGLLSEDAEVVGLMGTLKQEKAEAARDAVLAWAGDRGLRLPAFDHVPAWAWAPARWPPTPPPAWPARDGVEMEEAVGMLRLSPPRPPLRSPDSLALVAVVLALGSFAGVVGAMFLLVGVASVGGPVPLSLEGVQVSGPGPLFLLVGGAAVLAGVGLAWLAFRWMFFRRTLTFEPGRRGGGADPRPARVLAGRGPRARRAEGHPPSLASAHVRGPRLGLRRGGLRAGPVVGMAAAGASSALRKIPTTRAGAAVATPTRPRRARTRRPTPPASRASR